jgi:hypothetical protein
LAANSTIIGNNRTAAQILGDAGFSLVAGKISGNAPAKSEEQKFVQYYSMDFNDWYSMAKYSLANVENADATVSKFAQQLAARVLPIFSLNQSIATNRIAPINSTVFSETQVPSYRFAPNMASVFSSKLYGKNIINGQTYIISAQFHSDYAGQNAILGIYDHSLNKIATTTAQIDDDGLVAFNYAPTGLTAGSQYFFGLDKFTILSKETYAGLTTNLYSNHFASNNGLISFNAISSSGRLYIVSNIINNA